MSSVVDAILGKSVVISEDDVPPVMTGRTQAVSPARKSPPKDEENDKLKKAAAKRGSVVAGILGVTESDDEAIIPDDAKPFDTFNTQGIPGLKEAPKLDNTSPAEPFTSNLHGEELIPPTAALVAPDVTPNVLQLIDPSQVPAPPAPPAPPPMAAPTGPPPGAPQPGAEGALDTILGRQNPAPEPAPVAVESFNIQSKVAASIIPATEGGQEMPAHVAGDGKRIYEAFRKFNG